MLKYAVAASLIVATTATVEIPCAAAAPKSVTIALSDQLRVGYYWLYLPEVMGYWKAENLAVDVVPVGGSVEALQQLVAGHVQFGQLGSNDVIEANVKESIPAQIAMLNGVFQWRVGVLAGRGINRVEDLRGKSIGVYSLTTNGNLFLTPFLAKHGLTVGKDVQFVPVGYGGPALHALDTGDVAAVYYWPSAFTSYEDQGYHFSFYEEPDWKAYPDYAVGTLKTVVDKDPEMAVRFVRGMVKGVLFARTNPECAVKMYWKAHPDNKPTDVSDEKAMAQNLGVLKAQMAEYDPAPTMFGEDKLGAVDAQAIGHLQDFLAEVGQISSKGDPKTMIVDVPDFFAKVNAFDKAAVIASAKACTP